MRLNRLILAASLALLVLPGVHATAVTSPEVIRVGSFQVHSERLLARLKPEHRSDEAKARALASIDDAGFRVRRSFEIAPGLVSLERTRPRAELSVVVTEASRASRLLSDIDRLRTTELFLYVEPDYVRTASELPNDSGFLDGTLWGLQNTGQDGGVEGADINAARAWSITTGSPDVVVAVIDTGVRYDHVDLKDNMWVNPGEVPGNGVDDDGNGVIDDVHGFNAVAGNGDPFDDHSHGTHVSGTIAAVGNNGFAHVGVAWHSRVMGCKFLRAEGFGFDADAIDCINYSVKMGAKISNNSWGGGPFSQATQDAIKAAGDKGQLFVAAAGNSASDNDLTPDYPSGYGLENIIAVAAIDRKDTLADFSNFGRNSVHLGAPGVDIFSSINTTPESYALFDGTSMASPHVAGVAALVQSAFPKAPLPEVRDRIVGTTVPTDALRDTTRSGGRVDAYAALLATADGILDLSLTPTPGTRFLVGSSQTITVRVSDIAVVTNATVSALITYPDGSTTTNRFLDDGAKNPDQFALDGNYTARIGVKTNAGILRLTFTVKAQGKRDPTNTVYTYTVINRPENDQFARPEKIASPGGSVRTSLDYATRETAEPNHGGEANLGGSFWYSWSPLSSGTVLVDNYGSSARTVVVAYTGTVLTQLKTVATILYEAGRRTGGMTFPVTAGETYRIAVSGLTPAETGEFRLRVTPNGAPDHSAPVVVVNEPLNAIAVRTNAIIISGTAADLGASASGVKSVTVRLNGGLASTATGTTAWGSKLDLQPGVNAIEVRAIDVAENVSDPIRLSVDYRPLPVANDLFATARDLPDTGGLITLNTDAATREEQEPKHSGNRGGKSVWFRFVGPETGVLTVTTLGSTFDTIIAAYRGKVFADLVPVAANDDVNVTNKTSRMAVPVAAGEELKIAVDGFAGTGGNLRFSYKFEKTPVVTARFSAGPGGAVDHAGGGYPPGTTVSVLAIPAPDQEFVQWRGTFNSYQNPIEVEVTTEVQLEAVFKAVRITDDFESGRLDALPWKSTGSQPWTVQTETVSRGKFAARSGAIGDGQASELSVEVNLRSGIGSFDARVSSEEGWDVLDFLVDGQAVISLSGELSWATQYFPVTEGRHTLTWRYSKDPARSAGRDACFIDGIILPIRAPVSEGSRPSLSLAEVYRETPYYRLDGQLDQLYIIQASENLRAWTPFSTNANPSGFVIFSDPQHRATGARFFRAVVAPVR